MDNQIQNLTRQLKSLLERSGQKILAIVPDPPKEFLQNLDDETFEKLLKANLDEHIRRTSAHNSKALALGSQCGDDRIEKRTVPKRYY